MPLNRLCFFSISVTLCQNPQTIFLHIIIPAKCVVVNHKSKNKNTKNLVDGSNFFLKKRYFLKLIKVFENHPLQYRVQLSPGTSLREGLKRNYISTTKRVLKNKLSIMWMPPSYHQVNSFLCC